jgi:hypothetical protein
MSVNVFGGVREYEGHFEREDAVYRVRALLREKSDINLCRRGLWEELTIIKTVKADRQYSMIAVGAGFPFAGEAYALRIVVSQFDGEITRTLIDVKVRFRDLEEMCKSIPDFLLSNFTTWKDHRDVERYIFRLAKTVENIITLTI